MTMPIRRWTLALAAAAAFGQDAESFPKDHSNPWRPAWELTFRGDQLSEPAAPAEDFQRVSVQLRLRWTWDLDGVCLTAGTRSATGSDGNRFNPPRWDQQPSNATQLDVAHGDVSWVSEKAFGSLSLGFQENGLVASQALWDRNLRLLGACGMAGLRDASGLVQEASLRGVAGRVRNLLGGEMDLAAGQAVLKLDLGAWSWVAHAGRWALSWNPGLERLRRLPGHSPTDRQRMVVDAGGASATWNTVFPLEARWFRSKNRETGETSEEVQAAAGSRERTYWPQVSFTWQRLSSTGTLYPVNGDEWWFYRRTRGPRFDASLPFPGGWVASAIYIRQRSDVDHYLVTRKMLVLVKRF